MVSVMEQFLSLVGMQAMKLAVRSGIVFTSSYALKQYSHFLTTVNDGQLFGELKTLRDELDSKIKVCGTLWATPKTCLLTLCRLSHQQ